VLWNPIKKEATVATVWDGIDDTKIPLNFTALEEMFQIKSTQSAPAAAVVPKKEIKISKLRMDR
jgi:hypothetical protein